jgi:hypothetical protein
MKTKWIIIVTILAAAFYLGLAIMAQTRPDNGGAPPEENKNDVEIQMQDQTLNLNEENPEMDEEDFFTYDQEFFSRKLFQKKLPPLNKKEKIVWAFRMAEKNSFL